MEGQEILLITGENFGPYLEEDGLEWSRGDVFTDGDNRTMDGSLHVARSCCKTILRGSCKDVTGEVSRKLLQALKPAYVEVTFDSPEEGIITRTFLNRDPQCRLRRVYRNGKQLWSGLSFTLEEK